MKKLGYIIVRIDKRWNQILSNEILEKRTIAEKHKEIWDRKAKIYTHKIVSVYEEK